MSDRLPIGSQGKLPLGNGEDILLELLLHHFRSVSVAYLSTAVRKAATAQSVGPLLKPEAWMGKGVDEIHARNLDVLRRSEDLRRALEELDEAVAKHHPAVNEANPS
jgi:hypothetical protein